MARYPYVYYHPPTKRWFARIKLGGRPVHLGFFDTPESARDEVDRIVQELGLASSGKALCEIRMRPRKPGTCLKRFIDGALKVPTKKESKKRVDKVWEGENGND